MPTRVIQIEECQLITYEEPTEKMLEATGCVIAGRIGTKHGNGWILDADHLLMPVERHADRWHLRQMRMQNLFPRVEKAIPSLLLMVTVMFWCQKCRKKERHESDSGHPSAVDQVFLVCDSCGAFDNTIWFGDVCYFDVEWFSFLKGMHS